MDLTKNHPDENSYIEMKAFLTDVSPSNQEIIIKGLIDPPSTTSPTLYVPELECYCSSESCKEIVTSYSQSRPSLHHDFNNWHDCIIIYKCRSCHQINKLFALRIRLGGQKRPNGEAIKFGEWPAFHPRVPTRVFNLVGPDRELFLKGRRCELERLGVGAFAYYRQIVEGQKDRLLGEIKKVAQRVGAPQDLLATFDRAIKETQFSKAIEDIKDAVPESLLINNHNPLNLLHNALSAGLHAGTDDECLELAQDIRLVLTELAEHITTALKDEAALNNAISRLLQRPAKKQDRLDADKKSSRPEPAG